VQLRFRCGWLTFQDLLNQINATARAIEFITQQLVGGASGGTKAAMHTTAQNGIRLLAFVRIFNEISEIGLHLELGVHATRIENTGWIKGRFEITVYARHGRR
jgi:hypothetical protein